VHRNPTRERGLAELVGKTCFADPRLARDEEEAAAPQPEGVEATLELGELVLATEPNPV
jgi:hypothetical protein